jgi:hypothetical protein
MGGRCVAKGYGVVKRWKTNATYLVGACSYSPAAVVKARLNRVFCSSS